MKDKVNTPEKAAREHVWQYEHEVLEDEDDVTIKVADGTQIVGEDGKLYAAGQFTVLDEVIQPRPVPCPERICCCPGVGT